MTVRSLSSLLVLGLSTPAIAQHAQVSAVAVDPTNPDHVWVCNRDNDSVSVIDVSTQTVLSEIAVGEKPRSLAFSADGSTLLVTNQRGTVPQEVNFVNVGFDPSQVRGSVSVIDVNTQTVSQTIDGVGVEPYGVAYAPNGEYFVVSGFRSGTMRFFDADTFAQVAELEYLRNLSFLPPGATITDADADLDGIPDLDGPRGFTITSDSSQIYVTHNRSSWISILDVTLDGSGIPISVSIDTKIDTNEYQFHPIYNPVPVQTLESQGAPRFSEDIAISPDGTRAVIPQLLHNVNHDVNFNWTSIDPNFAGDFANRVYPALTMVDVAAQSFDIGTDNSNRLHHELSDTLTPAETVVYGETQTRLNGDRLTLGALTQPVAGQQVTVKVDGLAAGDQVFFFWGSVEIDQPLAGTTGNLLCEPRRVIADNDGEFTFFLPNNPNLQGVVACMQALVQNPMTGEDMFTNAVRLVYGTESFGVNKMGYRAGHPSRANFNSSGDHIVMLNRGSEDLFLYSVNGSDMELRSVFPPRFGFVERTPLDTSTPMGDLPLGMAVWEDPATANDDAVIYVINEATTSLSAIRVNYTTGTFHQEFDQITTIQGPDDFSAAERLGQEIFEDASRAQTTGNFNNSCASCHFEGGADGNVWQRPAGPRSTMPVYGGSLGTGLMLWKGVRLNLGETGPMFGGENGGHGIFSDAEQDALTAYHETIPFPINPNLDEMTGDLVGLAALGRDLFFATNESGLNPSLRHAGCATCHPEVETSPVAPGQRFYTVDFIDPMLSGPGEQFGVFDPDCFSLRENIVAPNIRNVNTGVNVDVDGMPGPDSDRNLDGFSDLETYVPMNVDDSDDFQRDDPNGYECPCDPNFNPINCDPLTNKRIFTRGSEFQSIPTKMGVFSTGPYMHDHACYSLRGTLDPISQMTSPIFGNPQLPGVQKIFNSEHDLRGHEDFVQGISKVQLTLQSTPATVEEDIDAILAFIQSL